MIVMSVVNHGEMSSQSKRGWKLVILVVGVDLDLHGVLHVGKLGVRLRSSLNTYD
jgi:hypothetical protein